MSILSFYIEERPVFDAGVVYHPCSIHL